VVNRDNPVRNIGSQQLADLVTGQLSNWKAVGGRDAPIDFAWRKGQGSVEFILMRLSLKPEQVGRHIVAPTDSAAIKFAASAPNAVTLASVGESERSIRNGAAIKLLAFNGVPASSRAIQNHSYMLSRPLVLVTRHLPQNLQKRFIDYALSSEVVDIQLRYGFVPYQE
jgi:phosphate transport system substrate-binding protein